MKGVVFTEFLDLVESQHGAAVVDEIITSSNLPSGGAYTAVGTYDHTEMIQLVIALTDHTGKSSDEVLFDFGFHLLSRFAQGYPGFFNGQVSSIQFLNSIDAHIHVEVKKLYPDAELPSFETISIDDSSISLMYKSSRSMSALAHGLIMGTGDFFKESLNVAITPQNNTGAIGENVRFDISVS